jgi:hypothetical protein
MTGRRAPRRPAASWHRQPRQSCGDVRRNPFPSPVLSDFLPPAAAEVYRRTGRATRLTGLTCI